MRGWEREGGGGKGGLYCHSDMIVWTKTSCEGRGGWGRIEQRTEREKGTTVIRLFSVSLA